MSLTTSFLQKGRRVLGESGFNRRGKSKTRLRKKDQPVLPPGSQEAEQSSYHRDWILAGTTRSPPARSKVSLITPAARVGTVKRKHHAGHPRPGTPVLGTGSSAAGGLSPRGERPETGRRRRPPAGETARGPGGPGERRSARPALPGRTPAGTWGLTATLPPEERRARSRHRPRRRFPGVELSLGDDRGLSRLSPAASLPNTAAREPREPARGHTEAGGSCMSAPPPPPLPTSVLPPRPTAGHGQTPPPRGHRRRGATRAPGPRPGGNGAAGRGWRRRARGRAEPPQRAPRRRRCAGTGRPSPWAADPPLPATERRKRPPRAAAARPAGPAPRARASRPPRAVPPGW